MATSETKKLLLNLSLAEGEGVGMWYEYLVKIRTYPKEKNKNILILGLPEKYGIGIDVLYFLTQGGNLTVVDYRQEVLNKFKKITSDFLGEVNLETKLVSDYCATGFLDNSFDLVINSEVLQQFENYEEIIKEMIRVSKKHIMFFVSNGACYAHPKFSGLNSYKLKTVKEKIYKMKKVNIKKAGYIDIPPWPSGIQVKQKGQGGKPSLLFKIVKAVAVVVIPILAWKERFIPPPLRQKLAHFIYFKLEKNG